MRSPPPRRAPKPLLTVLLPPGAAELEHATPLTLAIVSLLVLVFLSYRQTIGAYPNGGAAPTPSRRSQDGYLPQPFARRGRRLAFSHGIAVLAAVSAALLIAFHGVTDALIPLFAFGAFLAILREASSSKGRPHLVVVSVPSYV